jgi:AcrR family transcriptional regulator
MRTEAEGLRERKKRQTRETIAAAAAALFAARGYDEVTMVEVATAADVSEKTLYNYFPSKELLVIGEDPARLAGLERALRERAPGTSAAQVMRDLVLAMITAMARHDPGGTGGARGTMPYLVATHPGLRRWFLSAGEPVADLLAAFIAADLGRAAPDARSRVLARAVLAAEQVAILELGGGLARGETAGEVLGRVLPSLSDAFGDLDRAIRNAASGAGV